MRVISLHFPQEHTLQLAGMKPEKVFVGWTTVDSAEVANKLAAGLVAMRLAACVLVDGPVTAHYLWEGKQKRDSEWRLWVKFPSDRADEILAWLKANHPYSIPQWVTVEAASVSEPYRQWLVENTRPPFIPKKGKH